MFVLMISGIQIYIDIYFWLRFGLANAITDYKG